MMTTPKLVKLLEKESPKSRRKGLYLCFCGTEFITLPASINRGHTKSCGCYKNSVTSLRMKSHGLSKTSEFHTWQAMIQRCTNPNNQRWEHYGKRGIQVCDRWLNSFENFISDMGKRPEGYSLDRINNDLGYNKENCRWTTVQVQNVNKRQRRPRNDESA